MQATYVTQETTSGQTDFDRILSSIAGGIGDYLGRPQTVQAAPVPLPPAPTSAGTDFWFLALIALGVYALMK